MESGKNTHTLTFWSTWGVAIRRSKLDHWRTASFYLIGGHWIVILWLPVGWHFISAACFWLCFASLMGIPVLRKTIPCLPRGQDSHQHPNQMASQDLYGRRKKGKIMKGGGEKLPSKGKGLGSSQDVYHFANNFTFSLLERNAKILELLWQKPFNRNW